VKGIFTSERGFSPVKMIFTRKRVFTRGRFSQGKGIFTSERDFHRGKGFSPVKGIFTSKKDFHQGEGFHR